MNFDTLAKELSRGRALKLLGLSSLALFAPRVAEGRKKRRKHKKKNRANKVSPITPPASRLLLPPEVYICPSANAGPDPGPSCGQLPGPNRPLPPPCVCTLAKQSSPTCAGRRTLKRCASDSECKSGQFCGLDGWGTKAFVCIYPCQVKGGFFVMPDTE